MRYGYIDWIRLKHLGRCRSEEAKVVPRLTHYHLVVSKETKAVSVEKHIVDLAANE